MKQLNDVLVLRKICFRGRNKKKKKKTCSNSTALGFFHGSLRPLVLIQTFPLAFAAVISLNVRVIFGTDSRDRILLFSSCFAPWERKKNKATVEFERWKPSIFKNTIEYERALSDQVTMAFFSCNAVKRDVISALRRRAQWSKLWAAIFDYVFLYLRS